MLITNKLILPTTFFLGADAKFYSLTGDFGTYEENSNNINLISHLLNDIDIEADFDFDEFDQYNQLVLKNKGLTKYNDEPTIFILYYFATHHKSMLIHSFPFPQEELRIVFKQLDIPYDVL